MGSEEVELAGINQAIERQEKIMKELEDKLFVEQLRLAGLKAARSRALHHALLSNSKEDDGDGQEED